MTSEGKAIPEAVVRLRRLEDERRIQLHRLLAEVLEKGETNRLGLKRLHETRTLESEAKWELVQRAKTAFESSSVSKGSNGSNGLSTRTQSNSSAKKSSSSVSSSVNWLRRVVQNRPKLFTNRKRRVKAIRYQRPKSSYGIRSSNKIKPDLQTETELNDQFSDILSLEGESIRDSDDEDVGRQRYGLWPKKQKPGNITLRFNGLTTNCLIPRRVQISQQLYSGGNAVQVFDRFVTPGENLSFEVRSQGNSFCITVLIDGIRDLRVSTCCQYKHRKGSKISHFTLIDVIGGRKCANCRKAGNTLKSGSNCAQNGLNLRTKSKTIEQNEQNVNRNENNVKNVSDSEVEDFDQTVVELEKNQSSSSRTSSPLNGDYNEEQFEPYDSEFEIETPESLRVRTNSVSSDDNSVVVARNEVVRAEVHSIPL